jgi:hypothetical protein
LSRIWDALRQAERERSANRSGGEAAVDEYERRKNERRSDSARLLVYGSRANTQPFHEDVETIDANDEGCLFVLETPVLEGQRLFLVHSQTQAEQECRVVRIEEGQNGKARVAVEFSKPSPHFWRLK